VAKWFNKSGDLFGCQPGSFCPFLFLFFFSFVDKCEVFGSLSPLIGADGVILSLILMLMLI